MAFTSEPIPALTMQQYGVVNRVFSDDALAAESLNANVLQCGYFCSEVHRLRSLRISRRMPQT